MAAEPGVARGDNDDMAKWSILGLFERHWPRNKRRGDGVIKRSSSARTRCAREASQK